MNHSKLNTAQSTLRNPCYTQVHDIPFVRLDGKSCPASLRPSMTRSVDKCGRIGLGIKTPWQKCNKSLAVSYDSVDERNPVPLGLQIVGYKLPIIWCQISEPSTANMYLKKPAFSKSFCWTISVGMSKLQTSRDMPKFSPNSRLSTTFQRCHENSWAPKLCPKSRYHEYSQDIFMEAVPTIFAGRGVKHFPASFFSHHKVVKSHKGLQIPKIANKKTAIHRSKWWYITVPVWKTTHGSSK